MNNVGNGAGYGGKEQPTDMDLVVYAQKLREEIDAIQKEIDAAQEALVVAQKAIEHVDSFLEKALASFSKKTV